MKDLMNILRSHMTGSRETADRICRNEFELLGVHMNFGKYVDWEYGASRDIKIPWELSRFQFLPTLCRAYEIHHHEKYALHAKELIRDWILKNPAGSRLNWRIAMEAAIRACNFALAWFFLRESPPWCEKHFQETFLKSLVEHGKFIEAHLEYGRGFTTNHLIADFTGLFWLGVLFPELENAEHWKNMGRAGLEEEMKNQVYEDGVDYEASIPYHRLVTEFFGYSALLGKQSGIEFSPAFLERLEKMFEFAWYYTKPNGFAPQIGDNDDGRLFIFEDFYSWERRDHRHLFWLSSELFPENKKFVRSGASASEKESRAFEKGGIYIMRKDDFYCAVDCGPNGQNGNGGHAHNDTLSFELNIGGEDFIIDPGAFVYTGDRAQRKRFRGTQMHNTVMIDGKEMNRFRLFRLFSMHNDAVPRVNKWESTETHDFLDAQHSGHRRTFYFDKKKQSLAIKDFFTGKRTHKKVAQPRLGINEVASLRLGLEWNFHFASGVMVNLSSGAAGAVAQPRLGSNELASPSQPLGSLRPAPAGLRLGLAEKNGKKIEIRIPQKLSTHAKIRDDFVSPSYGIKEKAPVLTIPYHLPPTSYNLLHEYSFYFTILPS